MSQTPREHKLTQAIEAVLEWDDGNCDARLHYAFGQLREALRESAPLSDGQIMDEAFRERLTDDARVVAHLRAVPVGKCACPVHKYLAESAPPSAPVTGPSELALLEARREEAAMWYGHTSVRDAPSQWRMKRIAELDRAIAAAKGNK